MDDLRATPIEKGGAGPGEGSRPPLARSPRLEDPAAAPGSRPSWRRGSVLAVAFAGLLLRLALALAAPRWGFVGDHVANLMWGMAAADHGITNVYRIANGDLPSVTGTMVGDDGRRITGQVPPEQIGLPNHPPLTIALYDAQARLLRAFAPGAVLNTAPTRLLIAVTQMPFDVLLAAAVGLLAATVSGAAAGRLAAAFAWLFPPFALNSAFWGQVDTVFLAPAVLAVALLLRGRWAGGGALWGLAALLKPQALLLGPVVLFAALASLPPPRRRATRVVLARLARFAAGAALVVVALSLPWTLRGGLDWFERCYAGNILQAYPLTTLKAFNVWYLDALRLDAIPALVLDSHAPLLGVAKDTWGRALLLAGLAAAAALAWRRVGPGREGTVVFAALWLWSALIWPTRVHERYIIYALPFVLALAACRRRWMSIALVLLVVGSAEHTWRTWMRGVPAASLVSTEAVANRQREDAAAWDRLDAAARTASRPTEADAEREVSREAATRRDEYELKRRGVWPAELAVTLLSLAAYFTALWLVFGTRARASAA